jgi:hypothetical protein
MVRVILLKWYPDKSKLVYYLPSLFVLGSIILLFNSLWAPQALVPLVLLTIIIWAEALVNTSSFTIAFLAVAASYIQLWGYGLGFIKAYWELQVNEKDERKIFPQLFFQKK